MWTIGEFAKATYAVSKSHGFEDDPQNIDQKLLLAVGELVEAQNELRGGKEPTLIYLNETGKPEGFPIEIADCIIRLLSICQHRGIDIEYALDLKHGYNKTRPFKHGKQF